MNPLYNLGIRLYRTGVRIAARRGNVKATRMLRGHNQMFGTLRQFATSAAGHPIVWVHASSLGEFEQGRPLIELLRRKYPEVRILLTFFSPSGYEVRRNYAGADCVTYLPFDIPEHVNRFLDIVKPAVVFFIKYEFWGNYLTELKRRGIPTYLVSAIFRRGQIFFKPWGGMFRRMLGCYTTLFVQDDNSRRLLEGIGVKNVVVAGDTRFDRVTGALNTPLDRPGLQRWAEASHPLMVVGSSWPADEDVYIPWLKAHPEVRAVIAPHEFDAARLEALRHRLGDDTMLWSEVETQGGVIPEQVHYVIIDCFGLLSSLYRLADITYIGGGFGAGIHNIAEAAVYGVPVLFGPRHGKFREAGEMIAAGGGFSFDDAASFTRCADSLLADPKLLESAGHAAGEYIKSNLGATQRVLDGVDPALFR